MSRSIDEAAANFESIGMSKPTSSESQIQDPPSYVLIDFENVQPKQLRKLRQKNYFVLVFVGANQSAIQFDFAFAMQSLGDSGRYVKISGQAQDALDFHIAYYIGKLWDSSPKSRFHIISKDKGFDPLVDHLNRQKQRVWRHEDLTPLISAAGGSVPVSEASPINSPAKPVPKVPAKPADDMSQLIAKVKRWLEANPDSRPSRRDGLANWLRNSFDRNLETKQIKKLKESLEKAGVIKFDGERIVYCFAKNETQRPVQVQLPSVSGPSAAANPITN
ncbi:PIN domain-containing protein [Rhodopirellula sp. MGV]|uniref:PIN domain-containing protein n=1 Tax=Rhodopirellula sp. MGV TaxID=2023130 RepID=UPI000BDB848F|nr:PIN domain-containing protein [Rhodopirellula sp. MGV]OYP31166.1 hypothetical protein CGZ80_21495 [Rhodopirellula sp. MGV]PNY36011.1 hypothetical protein C2E31_14925 [Rhodopirellula baltica]